MALLGTLATLVAVGAAIPIDGLRVRNNINRNVARMEAEGRFRERDINLEWKLNKEISDNWYSGNKDSYPQELIPFLEENAGALFSYQEGMKNEAIIAMGYQPMGCGQFNIFTYDPYAKYHRMYGAVEKEWFRRTYPEEAAEQDRRQALAKKEAEERAQANKKAEQKKLLFIVLGLVAFGVFVGAVAKEPAGWVIAVCGVLAGACFCIADM